MTRRGPGDHSAPTLRLRGRRAAGSRLAPVSARRRKPRLAVLLAILVTAACSAGVTAVGPHRTPPPASSSAEDPGAPTSDRVPLLGAYYYSWFPENLSLGELGPHLIPPAGPDPSTEISADPATAERNIAAAASAGIDFFALDWWPNQPALNARIDAGFLQAKNLSSIHFAVLYETQALGAGVPYQVGTPMTPAARAELVANMVSLAEDYFSNPQYLRVGGRPVIFWYLTRIMTGDVAGAVAAVRAALAQLGYDPLIVGDELFWRVTTTGGAETTVPDAARARLFDAITWYNLYDASTPSLAGYGDASGFLGQINELVAAYRSATGGSVPILPDVIPGYNDRATRPRENHPAIPEEWAPGDPPGSFLQHMFDDVALPNVDPRLPVVMITSWNEWNEQTAIEPGRSSALTAADDSPSGTFYTQGYPYGGPGSALLDVVRQVAERRAASPSP
jgi:glycoprotein endo-alpha-1,2-mannosidase